MGCIEECGRISLLGNGAGFFKIDGKRYMKFARYIKIGKIYYFCSILLTLCFIGAAIAGLPALYRSYDTYNLIGSASKVPVWLHFIAGTAGALRYLIETLTVSGIMFFVFKNFKVIYAQVRNAVKDTPTK